MLDFTAEVEIAPGIFLSKPIKNSASSSSTAAAAAAVPESSFRPVSSNAALRLWKEFQQQAADTSSLAVLEQDLEDERNSVKKLLESNQEMRSFDPEDREMQAWIAENVVIIEKKLLRIRAFQEEIKIRLET